MLLVQHDLIFFVVRCFCGWYSNIKHLFQYIVLQCKKHIHIHVVRHHVKAKDEYFQRRFEKTSIWEDKLSVCFHIYKLELLKKNSILGYSLSQFVPFIYFPKICPYSKPQKRSTSSVCFPHLKRCTSQLCVDDLVLQLAGIPNLGVFWNHKQRCSTADPGGEVFPGETKILETSNIDEENLKIGGFLFFLFVFGVFVLTVGSSIGECSHFFLVLFVEISDGVRHGEQNYL